MHLINEGIEDMEHLLLPSNSFLYLRRNVVTRTYALMRPFGIANLSSEALIQLLLYGNNNLPYHINGEILHLILNDIHDSRRFQ